MAEPFFLAVVGVDARASHRRPAPSSLVDFGFPRDLRIHRTRDYREHRRRSRTFRTRHFMVAWAASVSESGSGRVGLTVSKKVGNSPVRSRVKRVLREWYRHHHYDFARPWDLVVIARKGSEQLSLQQVSEELEQLVQWLNRQGRREAQKRSGDQP